MEVFLRINMKETEHPIINIICISPLRTELGTRTDVIDIICANKGSKSVRILTPEEEIRQKREQLRTQKTAETISHTDDSTESNPNTCVSTPWDRALSKAVLIVGGMMSEGSSQAEPTARRLFSNLRDPDKSERAIREIDGFYERYMSRASEDPLF